MHLDIPALSERLRLLHLVRALIGSAGVGLALALPDRFAVRPAVVAGTAVLAVGASAALATCRRRHGGPEAAVRAVLAVDAAFLALLTAWSGQVTSPLLPAGLLELVAVTILLSWRAGLVAALWDALAFATAHVTRTVGLLPGSVEPADAASTVAVLAAFGACTALTAACSSYDRRALRQSRRHFQALSELALALEHATGAGAVGGLLADHLGRHLGFRRVAVLVAVPGSTAVARWSAGSLSLVELPPGLAEDPVVRQALDRGTPVWHPPPGRDGAGSLVRAALSGVPPLAVVAMRTSGSEVGGVVAVGETGALPLGAATTEVLRQAAAHGALALRNCRLLTELERQASRDPLTGLANRRALDERLARELDRCRREHLPLSVVLIDVDHFKQVNDVHGHQAGDAVLRTVAQVMAADVREDDLPARYGGEEFVVLLPGTALADAAVTAERLRREVAAARSGPRVTISAGVASFPGHADTGVELLASADAALYRAKRNGRDRVTVATTTGTHPPGVATSHRASAGTVPSTAPSTA